MKKSVYIRLNPVIWDGIRHYAIDNNISKSEAVEKAIIQYLKDSEWELDCEF